jgi:hypothetical protein
METEVSAPQSFNAAAQYLSAIVADPSLREDYHEAALGLAKHMGHTLALQKPFPAQFRAVSDNLEDGLKAHFYMGLAEGFEDVLKTESLSQSDRIRVQAMRAAAEKELRALVA